MNLKPKDLRHIETTVKSLFKDYYNKTLNKINREHYQGVEYVSYDEDNFPGVEFVAHDEEYGDKALVS